METIQLFLAVSIVVAVAVSLPDLINSALNRFIDLKLHNQRLEHEKLLKRLSNLTKEDLV